MGSRNAHGYGWLTIAALGAVASLGLGSCGGDTGPSSDAKAGAAKKTREPKQYGFIDNETRPYMKPASKEPKVRIPPGPPPKHLQLEELREGFGDTVDFGDEAVVNYVGYIYERKRHWDTSYGRNPVPEKVVPGRGDSVEGFEEGIVGMRVGGLRRITIPPEKGYGDKGFQGGVVRPGETMVFVVDLEALDKREQAGD